MKQVDAVVFDFGGVLTVPVRDSILAWQAADRIEPGSFTRALRAWMARDVADGSPVHRLETGELAVGDFEALLAAELRTTDGTAVQPAGLLSRLFAGMGVDEDMFGLVDALSAARVRVALLSNSWGNTYPRARIDALFEAVVISGEVGLRKPHPEIYRLTLDRLGLAPERAVFLDDAEPNVLGARAVGMRAHLHADFATTQAALSDLIPDLTPAGAPA